MLRNLILKLRQKPKAVREKIALGAAGGITTMVMLGWIVLNNSASSTVDTILNEGQQAASMFSTLIGQINERANEMRPEPPVSNPIATPEQELDLNNIQAYIDSVTVASGTPVVGPATSSATTSGVRTIRIATTSAATTTGE